MPTVRELALSTLRPERREKLLRVLAQRLGAVRLVVENLHDPHNASAVLRSCEAFGVQHVHAVEAAEAFTHSRRITLGAHKWLTLRRHETFAECAAELRDQGFRIYAALLDPGAVSLHEIPIDRPVALVLGNEKAGVSPEARILCDGAYTIPMAGFSQSLNISVAAAISLYDLTRRVRTERPDGGLLTERERDALLEVWLPKSARAAGRLARLVRDKARPSSRVEPRS
ncbi:MAG: RNA methyltransferase [Deltaproteobacteria bacterium]|nr:RNA methyltransferase [Deltaproteobacteria bacterium]